MLPEIFSEQQIDFEKFRQLFANEIATNPDRYALNWAGKSEAYQVLQTPTQQTLTPCEAESVDFAQSQNVFIEGENLEVLKVLQKSYFNAVKMIYIDPPYNTGNDFIYKDNFAESQADYAEKVGDKDEAGKLKRAFVKNSKENGHYHSNWLNMMLPRLHLARNLLRDDGVIFISIDDNEQAQLKLLCDEVFGAENFVGIYKWNKTATPPALSKKIRGKYEFILCYEKSINGIAYNGGVVEGGDMPLLNESNSERALVFPSDSVHFNFDGHFKSGIYDRIELLEDLFITNGKANIDVNIRGKFKWTQETVNNEINNGTSFIIKTKKFAIRYAREGERIKRPSDIISKAECQVGTNEDASKDIEKLFGKNIMSYPKPISLIKYLIPFAETDKNTLILDFFAGSATTAHAVMQLNAEDGGNRKFICVQLPEPIDMNDKNQKEAYEFCVSINKPANIAEISKERIRRVGKQIAEQYPDKTIDTGFKAFKLSVSHFKQWQTPTEQDLEKQLQMFIDPVAENTDTQAMMYELLLRLGFSLTAKVRWENQVYWVEENHQRVALILNEVNESIINAVMARQPQKVVILDRLFNGDDAFKKNTELQMSDANIALWVI
ncbi:site-specific DNA-methyltransferase [Avibacterium endocarditidis]|uniref:site-specific DNA-methyltransferase n=1 Tax=Avibacterium endocarditidis TaxID=380674 RepID=UPI003BF8F689